MSLPWKRVYCKNNPHRPLKDESHLEEVYCRNDPHRSLKDESPLEEVYCKNDAHSSLQDDLVPVGDQEVMSREGLILNSL